MSIKDFGLNFIQRYAVDIVMGVLGNRIQDIGINRLSKSLVNLGKAFGPPGLKHYSELTVLEQIDLIKRVPVLAGKHTDWPKGLQWVPRALTVWVGPPPIITDVIVGNVTELKPIPLNGEWYVLRGYLASTSAEGVHNRIGWRYDDVDGYYTLSFKVGLV